jgi:HlyD family secretion protein
MTLQPSLPAASPEPPATGGANGPAVLAAPAGGANGSALPKPSRLPRARRGSRALRILLPAAAVVAVLAAAAVWFVWFRGPAVRADLVTTRVEYKDLQLKVVERGTLEAKENRDIKCDVKAGSRGAPKIKWVVDNGTLVKKGDLLAEIDDSYLQEQATSQRIARDRAEADMITAGAVHGVKEIAIGLAEKNLEKWVAGDFPQQKHDLEGQIQTAESNLLQEEDRMAWVARMVKKNYMTASQEEAERAQLTGYKLALQKLQEQKKVLTDYTDPVNRKTFENAITQAKSDEQAALADLKAKTLIFEQQKALYDDLQAQIKQCRITAEHAGIVVYAVPEQTRSGSGATQSIIAQGEPAQYGQKLMSIPDLSHMLVNVRVHEAFINHMNAQARLESVDPDGPADRAGLKPGDVITRLGTKAVKMYPDLIDALRGHKAEERVKVRALRDREVVEAELTLAARPGGQPVSSRGDANWAFGVQFQEGLPAMVRVDAVPGRMLKAHVKSVANVASPQDWMSPDVKVYQAYVEIDENVEDLKLKPGLSAVCTVFTEERSERVLAVPLGAVDSRQERGAKPRCFVQTPRGPEAREVELGLSDEKYVEIKSGLNEGDEVVLNPRALLSDKEKKAVKEDDKLAPPDGKGKGKGKGKAGGPGDGLLPDRKQ